MTKPIMALAVCLLIGAAEAVDYSSIQVDGKRVTLCRVNVKKERLQLYHRDENGTPFRRFDRLAPWLQARGLKLVFAMNAGMYHGNMSAVGLVVADGKTLVPLNTADGEGNFFLKPNGIFAITESGARVIATSEYSTLRERVILATQSGPLLVRAGKVHPAFNAGSKNLRYRNGVGVPSPDIAIFAITEEQVNLHQFATMFRDTLHCPDAL
jgi:uncharacterized protein YigE (DUF2233 family)